MIMVVGSKAASAYFCKVLWRFCDFSHSSMTVDFGARWHGARKPPGHAPRRHAQTAWNHDHGGGFKSRFCSFLHGFVQMLWFFAFFDDNGFRREVAWCPQATWPCHQTPLDPSGVVWFIPSKVLLLPLLLLLLILLLLLYSLWEGFVERVCGKDLREGNACWGRPVRGLGRQGILFFHTTSAHTHALYCQQNTEPCGGNSNSMLGWACSCSSIIIISCNRLQQVVLLTEKIKGHPGV